jgi:hypothetical protein
MSKISLYYNILQDNIINILNKIKYNVKSISLTFQLR